MGRLFAALAVVVTGITLVGGADSSRPAAADTPFSFLNETFNEGTFPPTNWSAPNGTWSSTCTVVSPETGCAAVGSFTGGTAGLDQLLFNPSVGIPANVQNLTLSFYSDFSPSATTQGDSAGVYQASVPGATGDFNQLASIAGPTGNDTTKTPVLHTIPLSSTNLPISFRWTSFGDSSTTTTGTWDITNVTITGTVPSVAYTLTANPISNTVYPHIVAGNGPYTITLSGSSNPTGDSLQFAIATSPTLGTLGPITQVDATHATVTYSPPALACPDPNGTSGFICTDPFKFTVHDAEGNSSSPAQVDLEVLPGGAAGQVAAVSAPATAAYTTISQNGNLVQAADLSGAVTIGPSAFPDEIQLELQASSGTIDLINGVASGVTFINGTGNNQSTIYMTGSVTKLNQAIGEFIYFPPSGTTPTATIHMFPTDMGPTGGGPFTTGTSATTTINGVVTNPPPSLAVPTGSLSIANNAGPLTFPAGTTTGFLLTDAGASATTQDEVLMSVSGGTLALPAADTSGPGQLVTAQSLGGGSTLDITGTVAHINMALPDLTFDPSHLPSETVMFSASAVDPDTGLASPQKSISIQVIQAPFPFGATSFSTLQGSAATFWLCGGGPPADSLTFAITTSPIHGTLVADPSANPAASGCSPTTNVKAFTYTPSAAFTGSDGFVYSITDPTTGLVSMGNSVAITVSVHQKPTAYNVTATTVQDTAATIVLCGKNPEPAITPTLTFDIVFPPSSGTLTDAGRPSLNPCNQGNVAEDFTYTPNAGTFKSNGTDSFTYQVTNGTFSDPATGTITVTTLTPQVIGYPATVNENSSIGLNLCSTAQTVDAPTFTIVSGPAHGTVDQNTAPHNGPGCPTGYFNFGYEHYTPTQLYSGTDQIGYTATETGRTSVVAFIDITVQKVEIPPTANSQTVTDIAPQPVAITLSGSSLQGSSLTFNTTSDPQHGTLSGTAPNLIYTPSSATFAGTDSFTYVANDGVANSPPATVTIHLAVPRLGSSVCYAGTAIDLFNGVFNCAGTLTAVSSPQFGAIELAHTSGAGNGGELQLQQTITNQSSASDTVTLTAPAGTAQWPFIYDVQGADQTAALTGSGLTVTLGPAGTSTDFVDVQIIVFPPITLPAPAVVSTHVLAVSGNNPAVSTQIPIEVQDGTSHPTLTLAQAGGVGGVSFPTALNVTPPLFNGGPAGTVDIEAGLSGTGINTFAIHATVAVGSTPSVTPTFFLAKTDVTAAVLAGTEVITCYAGPFSCPPMSAKLTPGAGSGYFSMEITIQSTIDGQGTQDFAVAQLAGAVGPDLWTTLPNIGTNVFEPTPVTQTVAKPVELSGSATQTIYLANAGDVSDTYTVRAAVTTAAGDASVVTVGASAPGIYGLGLGSPSDVTRSITGTGYQVTIPASEVVAIVVTDTAAASTATAPPNVVVTATSQLDPAKVDSFQATFPTYFYRPDAMVTDPNNAQIGANVYQQNYFGPIGNSQDVEYNVDQAQKTTIDVSLTDRGQGPMPTGDAVVVTSPTIDPNFDVSYTLLQYGTSTDVTSAITGTGLPLTLAPGAPMPVIRMSASASVIAQAGHPGTYPLTVTSQSSLPAGLADVVVIGLYNQGQSQLRFAGLPQPEPSDITRSVNYFGRSNRVAPFPNAGYAPGVTYGAYSDPTAQKFAYVSGYDTFDLQVASEIVSHTAYRIQMVDPGPQLVGLPAWERENLGLPYYNPNVTNPADPFAPGSGLNPTITAGGQNITAAVENGTYTTASLGTNETSNITVSFAATIQQRYTPIRFNLINAATGELEDVMVVDPISVVSCTPDGQQQVQQTITTSTGSHKLNFEAWDRTNPQNPVACLQHLSHSWITSAPLVFGQYVPEDQNHGVPAGGNNPVGLWMMPQPGSVLRVNTDTGVVTGNANAFVDSPITDANGAALPSASTSGLENYYFLGQFPALNWNTTDGTNGLKVGSDTLLPPSPFPLVHPSGAYWPSNTMDPARYFQVDGLDGAPVMVGDMTVNIPWFHGDVPLIMELSSNAGLTLNYPAPQGTVANLPTANNTSSLNFYNFYWNSTKNGTVTQGGCLGVPSEFWVYLGLSGGPNICLLGATVSFSPSSQTPGAAMKVSQITVALINPGLGVKGSPEFNINAFSGEIDLDPATQDVTKVVLNPVFGVGPPTGCQEDQNLGLVTGLWKNLLYLPCPSNLFFFNAKITYQAGGFNTGYADPAGFGLQFSGTLTFLNIISLSNIEADISSSPFNFHFGYSPIDVAISPSIPVSASLTFSGDIGAAGFSIGVKGQIIVAGVTIAGASGILSSKGIGVCGTVAGLSMGFGDAWGSSPQVYPSGCDTTQFEVGA